MSSAGGWKIDLSEPWPVWVSVSYGGKELIRFSHDGLRDLEYAVGRAIVEARARLPEHCKGEMD